MGWAEPGDRSLPGGYWCGMWYWQARGQSCQRPVPGVAVGGGGAQRDEDVNLLPRHLQCIVVTHVMRPLPAGIIVVAVAAVVVVAAVAVAVGAFPCKPWCWLGSRLQWFRAVSSGESK